MRSRRKPLSCATGLILACAGWLKADVPEDLPPVAINPGGIAYWSRGPFANTMQSAHDWIEFRGNDWGTQLISWNNPQFDANGYPKYLQPGQKLRTLMWPFSATSSPRPSSWPKRDREAAGKVVLTWRGAADIRLSGPSYVAAESSGPATGLLRNGRRVYLNSAGSLPSLTVEEINSADPVTDIKVWLPDPAAPMERALDGHAWHPNFLRILRDIPFGHVRLMDFGETNQNPQQDWADRRLPSHRTMHGVLNPRSPAPGAAGNRTTGMAWEMMVDLGNTLDRDIWICVPHLATDDYVTKLAQLIAFGSDGAAPYATPQSAPIHRPLAPHLRVWVEYSNEIWSNGGSFSQGDWAQAEGAKIGVSKAVFNARRSSQIWSLFQRVLGGSSRLVRVAAIFTANNSYTDPFLNELARYGTSLSPAVQPDVVSPTTYFGNGIQDWAFDTAIRERGGSRQWFLTAQDFASGAVVRPVSVPASDPYWTSPKCAAHLAATIFEWKRRIFSGSTAQGAGPDATGMGGGFSDTLSSQVRSVFGRALPLVSYEGGPSLYTDDRDGGDPRDDGITTFMEALNRRPEMREILALHMNLSKAKGLRTNTLFVDVSQWGKYGQWGHLEYPDQRPEDAPKWMALRDHDADMRRLRPVDQPKGGRPRFLTGSRLAAGVHQQVYSAEIEVRGGDYAAGGGPRFRVIASLLDPGLGVVSSPGEPNRAHVTGRPLGNGPNYFLLRAEDDDGDAAWRIFSFEVGGGPGVVVQSRFAGTNPARQLPWKSTFAISPEVAFSGWSFGKGVQPQAGDDALVFSVNAPADKSQSTLARALAEEEFLACTLSPVRAGGPDLREAVVRFTVRRDGYHAPRRYSLFASVGGFQAGAALYTSSENNDQGSVVEHTVTLPKTAAWTGWSEPIEFRLVPHAGQYAGHAAALAAFSLTLAGAPAGFGATVEGSTGDARLSNLSSRAVAGHDADALVAGFVVRGTKGKRVLLRGAGPALASFGITAALQETRLELYAGQELLRTNDGWDRGTDAAETGRLATQLRAFAFAPGSRDAAMQAVLTPGLYTAQLKPARSDIAPGLALIEVYDADGDPSSRLVNLSTRAKVGSGAEVLIAGFVIAGEGRQRLLLRGIGPGLSSFGLAGALAEPHLALYSGDMLEEANEGWQEHSAYLQIAALGAQAGAFALASGGRDAALLTLRGSNRHTAHLTSRSGDHGLALIELYDAP